MKGDFEDRAFSIEDLFAVTREESLREIDRRSSRSASSFTLRSAVDRLVFTDYELAIVAATYETYRDKYIVPEGTALQQLHDVEYRHQRGVHFAATLETLHDKFLTLL